MHSNNQGASSELQCPGVLSATDFKHSQTKHTHTHTHILKLLTVHAGSTNVHKSPSTHAAEQRRPQTFPQGIGECFSTDSGHWDMILLAPDAAEERTRIVQ